MHGWGKVRFAEHSGMNDGKGVRRYESLKHSELPYLPVSWEESQRLLAADFPETGLWEITPEKSA